MKFIEIIMIFVEVMIPIDIALVFILYSHYLIHSMNGLCPLAPAFIQLGFHDIIPEFEQKEYVTK